MQLTDANGLTIWLCKLSGGQVGGHRDHECGFLSILLLQEDYCYEAYLPLRGYCSSALHNRVRQGPKCVW
jgi:hypothetical protein